MTLLSWLETYLFLESGNFCHPGARLREAIQIHSLLAVPITSPCPSRLTTYFVSTHAAFFRSLIQIIFLLSTLRLSEGSSQCFQAPVLPSA